VSAAPPPATLFHPDPGVEARQAERLRDLRRRRDGDRAARALDAVERAARGTENLVPRVLDAVRAEATLGEISARLRAVFGVHRPSVGF
jgi:methylmalonyl-CoA mutase N-terminal domain/subunit